MMTEKGMRLPRRPAPIELRLAPNWCGAPRNDIKAGFLLLRPIRLRSGQALLRTGFAGMIFSC